MKDTILKHLHKSKACGSLTEPPKVCDPYIDALEFSVRQFSTFYGPDSLANETINDILEAISTILGIEKEKSV